MVLIPNTGSSESSFAVVDFSQAVINSLNQNIVIIYISAKSITVLFINQIRKILWEKGFR